MVLWDLKTKKPECRWQWSDSLKSIDWHFEGKQFTCSHNDGSLTTWNVKPSAKPANIIYPHGEYTVGRVSGGYRAHWVLLVNPRVTWPRHQAWVLRSFEILIRLCTTMTTTTVPETGELVVQIEWNIINSQFFLLLLFSSPLFLFLTRTMSRGGEGC